MYMRGFGHAQEKGRKIAINLTRGPCALHSDFKVTMKISLEWLAEYLPGPLDAAAAAEALTNGGLPVEHWERFGDDTVLDVEVTSNRGDCLSHVGVARELAALLGREFRDVSMPPAPAGNAVDAIASVRIDASDLCPHYTARILRGVKVQPSPAWMQRRLEALGLRPINNVVDVTNYVMFELGQPLHAFDFNLLEGRRIIVRRAKAGEKLQSLDGKERTLLPDMLVIADAASAVALAGVMGGKATEITPTTTDVLLESARFDPLSVRRTTRALAMEKTDSSYRFERSIDPAATDRASLRAAQLILQLAGGECVEGCACAGGSNLVPKKLTLRLSRIRQVLGIDVDAQEAVAALARLQFKPQINGQCIDVMVPSWRLDVGIEVDLIEEIARLIGYGRIPTRQEIAIRLSPPGPDLRTRERIRSTLVGAGYCEAITFSFVSDLLAGDFLPREAVSLPRAEAAVRKDNAHLRPSLLPGLLESVARNENAGNLDARLFETGSIFWADAAGKIIERPALALVGSSDIHEVRGVVEELLSRLDADKPLAISPEDRSGFAAGACASVEWGGKKIGFVGIISRAVAEKSSLRQAPAAAELGLGLLLEGAQPVPQLNALPKYPAIRRDLSLILPEATRYQTLADLVKSLNLPDLE
jgi:phenylalanyl-tRNA synthetase beta chain